jgi:uncharacterized protein with ParB-like and HNH nuclease domain
VNNCGINAAVNEKVLGHFVGSIVYIQRGIYQSSTVPELVVIDGQQRITTILLLLKALGRALDKTKIEGGINSKKINNLYLLNSNEDENDDLRHKLILTRTV